MKKALKNVVEVMEWLKSAQVLEKYITPAGEGFLDGIASSDYEPEVISMKEYKELELKNKLLEEEIQKLVKQVRELNNKKRWF